MSAPILNISRPPGAEPLVTHVVDTTSHALDATVAPLRAGLAHARCWLEG
jgi:hypothetical protein